MSVGLLQFLLYVPLLALVLIVAVPYLFTGYKKGLFSSLVSLGATVLSAVLSVVFSNLISGALSPFLLSAIPQDLLGEMGVFRDFVLSIVSGLLKVILSFVLFGGLFAVLITLLKFIANRISKRFLPALPEYCPALRWGGLATRLVDGVLVSLLIALPLYAFLSTAAAPAGSLLKMVSPTVSEGPSYDAVPVDDLSQWMPYVDCITGHPMVKLYQAQPAALVVSHLARFEMKEAKVDIAKMANTVSGLAERIDTIKASNPEDRMEAVKEFTEYARDSVVSEDWCYDLVVGAKEGLSETLQEVIPDDQIRREAEEALALLDMTREEFAETATAVLDFASHVLENELIEKATAGELSQIPEETVTMLGGILNQNETILSLKKYVVESVVEEVFVHSYGENPTDADWENRAKTDSQDFVNRYFGTGKVSESERNSEAEAFLSLLSSGSEESVRDAISRHPLFGDSAVADLTRLGILSPAA